MSTAGAKSAIVSRSLALTLSAGIQALTGFGVQVVLMRLLVPEDFGRFALVLAGCSLVQTIVSLRLNILIIRLPQSDVTSAKAKLYQAALVWETLLASTISMVWLLSSDLMSGYTLTLLASLTLGQWTNQSVAFYERGMAYGRIAAVESGSQMAGHLAALALALLGAGPVALYIREIVAIAARLAAFAAIGALLMPIWRRPRLRDLRSLIRQTRGIWLEGLLEGLLSRVVVVVSVALTGLHGAGILAQSQRLVMLPHQFLSPVVARMAMNMFSRTTLLRERQNLLVRLLAVTLALLIVAAIAILLWAAALIPWIFGPNWIEAATIVQSLIGVVLFLSVFDLLRAYCYASGLVLPVVIGRLVQLGSFCAAIWLCALYGSTLENIAWSVSVAQTAGVAAILILLWRKKAANL